MSKTNLGQVVFPPKKAELIESFTLEEDTSLVDRTQEPDGTEYRFTSLMVFVRSSASVTAATFEVYVYGNNGVSLHINRKTSAKDNYFVPLFYKVDGGFITVTNHSGDTWASSTSAVWGTTTKPTVDYISKIRFFSLKAGVTISIYGIRKE